MKELLNPNPLDLLDPPATRGDSPASSLNTARDQLDALSAVTDRILSGLRPNESRSFLEHARQHGGQ